MSLKSNVDVTKAVMVDTNVFNLLLDGQLRVDELNGMALYLTHIQIDELNATKQKDPHRAADLLRVVKQVDPAHIATSVFVLGHSRLGQAALGDGEIYTKVFRELQSHRSPSEKNAKHESDVRDGIIAETAFARRMTLLTFDRALAAAVKSLGGKVDFRVRG